MNQELEFEEDNYSEDASIKQYLQENKWTLEDKEGSNTLSLKRVSGKSAVQIFFNSKTPNFDENKPDEEEGEEGTTPKELPDEENGENNEDPQYDVTDFNVYISQGKKVLAFECTSFNGEVEVNTCNVVDDINTHRMLNVFSSVNENYRGPEFSTLDESLRMALLDLLRSHGVNEELATLIEQLAVDKEQRLYVKWLANVKQFIAADK